MFLLTLLAYLLVVGYGCGSLLYLFHLSRPQGAMGRWGTRVMSVCVSLHLLFLVGFTIAHRRLPLAHWTEAVLVLTWFSAAMYLLFEWRLHERTFGTFIAPILFLLQLTAVLSLDMGRPVDPILRDVFFEVHVILNLLAYAAFALSFITSLMYVLLHREITQRHWGIFYARLPSLQFLSGFSLRAGIVGFALITAGIAMGMWNAFSVWPSDWSLDSKILTTFAIWLIYGVFALLYWSKGWYGKRHAYLSIFGFVWVLFSFIIVSHYLSGFHSF